MGVIGRIAAGLVVLAASIGVASPAGAGTAACAVVPNPVPLFGQYTVSLTGVEPSTWYVVESNEATHPTEHSKLIQLDFTNPDGTGSVTYQWSAIGGHGGWDVGAVNVKFGPESSSNPTAGDKFQTQGSCGFSVVAA